VIDKASKHNKQQDQCPTSATTKMEMQEWLRSKNIPFGNDILKPQLYEVIKMNKPRYKIFKIDKLFHDAGHYVLRLPPYHPDLNPIELVWTAMKEYVAARNVKFNLSEATKYCDEFFEQFSVERPIFCII
jgi:transposase